MGLGIGANVTLFTVVRGVLLKPLPFENTDRLVMLYEWGFHENDAVNYDSVSGGMYDEWKKQNQSFSSLALVRGSRVGLSGSGGQLPEKLISGEFSWDLLRTLGVQAALGRDFVQADDRPGVNATVLLSWGLWKRRFGGDPAILNHVIYIDAQPYTVIGIMPAWFNFPDPATQLWTAVYHERRKQFANSFGPAAREAEASRPSVTILGSGGFDEFACPSVYNFLFFTSGCLCQSRAGTKHDFNCSSCDRRARACDGRVLSGNERDVSQRIEVSCF